MKVGINLKIDVTKIDKARIFNGQKGKYIDLTAFVDLDQQDEYGNNGFIAHQVSKQEREQGVQGAIVGNSKVFYTDRQQAQQQSRQAPQQQRQQPMTEDDWSDDPIPF